MNVQRRLMIGFLCACVLSCATPAFAFWPFPAQATPEPTVQATQEDAQLRVWLKSLADQNTLTLTTQGVYAVDRDPGFRLESGSTLFVFASGDQLSLSCGGLTVAMGNRFTLTRHASDAPVTGLVLHETERDDLYTGDLQIAAQNGALELILTLDLEDYLLGVLPYEMSDSFPLEALKAQAVAARSYALSRRASSKTRAYDVVDTTGDQVYRGMDAANENVAQAVEATRHVAGLYDDAYAACFFTASNGGQTALPSQVWQSDADAAYLAVTDDPFDVENPSSVVKTYTVPKSGAALDDTLARKLVAALTEPMSALGYSDEQSDIRILSVDAVSAVDPKFGEGNRMAQNVRFTLSVEGKRLFTGGPAVTPDAQTTPANQVETVSEPLQVSLPFYGDLKDALGLKINAGDVELLSVTETDDGFELSSRRFGHGIGMSQRGAQQMAKAGKGYLDILTFYYPGLRFARMDFQPTELTALSDLTETLGRARPRATPRPTPAPLPALADGERYATVTLASKGSTLNVRETPDTQGALTGTLIDGQRVIVLSTEDGWARIKTSELSGYASLDYLK